MKARGCAHWSIKFTFGRAGCAIRYYEPESPPHHPTPTHTHTFMTHIHSYFQEKRTQIAIFKEGKFSDRQCQMLRCAAGCAEGFIYLFLTWNKRFKQMLHKFRSPRNQDICGLNEITTLHQHQGGFISRWQERSQKSAFSLYTRKKGMGPPFIHW